MKKIALGMSGGVDSSLCAHLLAEAGYEVTGVYLECWRAPGCRTDADRKDALEVALTLGIPYQVLDFKTAYRQKVVDTFLALYKSGLTPNPDILCNQEIKFGLFYDWAMKHGFDAIATGHYAKRIDTHDVRDANDQNKSSHLYIPQDTWKDQTYFLHQITQEQLQHTLFPLSDLKKSQVRELAQKRKIAVSQKKDSVGICFIGDIDVRGFLRDELGEKPGKVKDLEGNVVGTHRGIWFYTIGQRSGFTINPTRVVGTASDGATITKQNIPPFYVLGKDAPNNELIVGFGSQTQQHKFRISQMHWISGSSAKPNSLENLQVRIRHTGELLPCIFDLETHELTLDQAYSGIAPGQYAVLYQTNALGVECLGGGVIELLP